MSKHVPLTKPITLVERLREMQRALEADELWDMPKSFLGEVADEIERLGSVADAEMKLREGNFAEISRLERELAEALDGCRRWSERNMQLVSEIEQLQARIDSLMLEFCPDEMSDEQRAEWGRRQICSVEPAEYHPTDSIDVPREP
jgi:hypothetical protein